MTAKYVYKNPHPLSIVCIGFVWTLWIQAYILLFDITSTHQLIYGSIFIGFVGFTGIFSTVAIFTKKQY